MFNPVLRGWLNYYGRFHGSAMTPVWQNMNAILTRWLRRKYKHVSWHKTRAKRLLSRIAMSTPKAFVHWELGYAPAAE